MFASSPWAGAVLSATLCVLTLSLLGVIYRRLERRAFWVGFALCGWTYMMMSSGWFINNLRSQLATSTLLEWAYPRLIPAARQAADPRNALRPFVLPPAALEGGLTIEELKGVRVDVWAKAENEKDPSLLVEGVRTADDPASGSIISRTTLMTDADQFAKLARAKAYSHKIILRPHSPGPLAQLWASPPVQPLDFENVGHSFCALLSAWIGSIIARYAYATRDSGDSSAAVQG